MIGAVIVAYRDAAALDRCLRSMATVLHVVVVNVTGDVHVARAAKSHHRLAVDVAMNVGYAGGVNVGVRRLPPEVDWVLFANDDIRLLTRLVEWGGADVSVPRQVSPEGVPLLSVHPLPTPAAFVRRWVLARESSSPAPGSLLSGSLSANGAAVIAHRSVLERHPLPEEYFMYWEETAWFWRLADAGVTVGVHPSVVVERPPGSLEHSPFKAQLLGENLVRIGRERYGAAGAVLYRLLGFLWIVRLALTDVRRRDTVARWCLRVRMLRGLFHPQERPQLRWVDPT